MDEEKLSSLRWGLYTGCLILSVFIPLTGGMVEKFGGGWAVSLTTLYIMWAIMFGLFGMTFFERSSQFIIRCLYYLVCAFFPFAFFGSLANNSDLHLWMPTSLTMGIFVGQGISDCCALITAQRLRRIVLRILPAEEAPLPLYNDNDNPELVHLTRNFPNDSYISEVCMCQCQEYSVCSCDQTEASILNDTLTSSSANTTFEEERINVSPATSNIDPIGRLNGQLTSEWSSRPMRNPTSLDASKLPVGSMDNPWAFE